MPLRGSASHGEPTASCTFQGVTNYYPTAPPPPPQPHPVVGFPQPIPPPATYGGHYYQGYQTVLGFAVVEGWPIREHRPPCCGRLVLDTRCIDDHNLICIPRFITGFFLGGIPWYAGTIVLLCVQMDYR